MLLRGGLFSTGLFSAIVVTLGITAGIVVHGTDAEDWPTWDCRWQGNHICGPSSDPYEPGLYEWGKLIEKWDPSKHYGVTPGTEYDHLSR